MYQLRRIGQIGIEPLLIVLPQDGTVWSLEEDVVAGVACFKLAEHFGRQVVVDILRLPITVGQLESVNERTINDNPLTFTPTTPGH